MDKSDNKYFGRVVFFALLWIISYAVCLWIIKKGSPSTATGIFLSFIPVITFGLFIYSIIKGIGSMDEVEIRVQMEAVVIAFSLGLLTLMTLGLLDLVITIKKEDWGYRHLVPYFTLFYIIGLIITKRKYD